MDARERARRAVSNIADGRMTVTIKPSRLEDLIAREIRCALDEAEMELVLRFRQSPKDVLTWAEVQSVLQAVKGT